MVVTKTSHVNGNHHRSMATTITTSAPMITTKYQSHNNSNYKSVSKCDNATTLSSTSTSTATISQSMLFDTGTTNRMKAANTKVTTPPPPPPQQPSKPKGGKLVQQQIRNGWFRWLFGGARVARRSDTTRKNHTKSSNRGSTTTNVTETTTKNPSTCSFLRLARERRFDDIVTVLTQSSTSSPAFLATWLQVQQASRSSVCECLHALCLYRPTPIVVKVVQEAIKLAYTHNAVVMAPSTTSPSVGTIGTITTTGCISDCVVVNAALVTDAHGRTPLHIAVACGCSFEVIDLLLQDDCEAAYMMDHTNRYPLHWACTCTSMTATAKSYSSREREVDNIVQIINRLMEIYAMAIISKDDMGCTPLDIAKSANADPRIVRALQFVKNILPVKKRIKSHPDEATVITGAMSKYPTREAICIYDDNHNFTDDVSSIGSRGVSKARCRRVRRTRSESPKSSRVRELVDI